MQSDLLWLLARDATHTARYCYGKVVRLYVCDVDVKNGPIYIIPRPKRLAAYSTYLRINFTSENAPFCDNLYL